MNWQLEQRNKFLEGQLELHKPRQATEVVRNASSSLTLTIPDRGSPSSSLGGRSSPASTQSEPVFLKTEEQDDIDQIIMPTQLLHVRNLFTYTASLDT